MRRIYLFLCFSLLLSSAYAQAGIGGVDPSTLTNSDLKRLGFNMSDLQNYKAGTGKAGDIKGQKVIRDTLVDIEDTLKNKPGINTDSAYQAKLRESRFTVTYGKSFFTEKSLSVFRSASHLKAPDDYILGPGDEINVAIWGYAEVSFSERIGDDGSIYPSLVGKIFLNGLTMGAARKLIKAKFGSVYDLKNSQISIELTYAKVIRVNIVGEVTRPGTYSVSSLNSAFNVLSVAGGLTDLGSVRNIVIKRDNKVVRVLDVYKFLSDPNFANDFFLQNNDYIVVQPLAKVVFVKGEIGREGKYELTKTEGVADLIKYAGNLDAMANTSVALAVRIEDNHFVVKDLDLKGALKGKFVPLFNGDTVLFLSVNDVLRNYVQISGAVEAPGKYQYKKGETVKQFYERAGGLRFDAYLGRAYVMRTYLGGEKKYFHVNLKEIMKDSTSSENLVLEELDQITIFSTSDFYDEFFVEISGAVRNPIKMPYSENITLQDLVFFAGGLLNEAANKRIEISRMVNYTDKKDSDAPIEFIVETFDVSDDLELNKMQEVKLRPADKVFVRFVEDFQFQRLVILTGEFKYPGTYALLHDKETIKEVVERAGGFNEGAFLRGAKMIRSLDNTGELVVDFDALFNANKEQYNYVLRAGDTLMVPKIDDIIAITGEVGSTVVAGRIRQNAPYTVGKRARYYVKEYAGGFTKSADRSKVYVISSSGKVKKSKNWGLFRVYPKVKRGDRIVVDKKEPKPPKAEDPTDWNRVIEHLTVKITGIMTLYLLTKNVFK